MMPKKSALSQEIRNQLKQGTKIRFKWWGNDSLVYTGRIETNGDALYYVSEHEYENNQLRCEGMRYYNPLHTFEPFTQFEVLK